MKILRISAIWCSACLIMNKVWNKLKENYEFEPVELDLDMDEEEANKYKPKDVLPVFIVFDNDKEILRLTGEFTYESFLEKLKKEGVNLEEKY